MKSPTEYLREWGRSTRQAQDVYWPKPDHVRLRMRLIREEENEVHAELTKFIPNRGSRPALAKELADLVYVVYGTAVEFGIDLDEAVRRVHESNMTKDFSTVDSGGKVLKGDGYREPFMDDFGPVDSDGE